MSGNECGGGRSRPTEPELSGLPSLTRTIAMAPAGEADRTGRRPGDDSGGRHGRPGRTTDRPGWWSTVGQIGRVTEFVRSWFYANARTDTPKDGHRRGFRSNFVTACNVNRSHGGNGATADKESHGRGA